MSDLRELTPARVALGRAGASLPTEAWLKFALDHARARDAVHASFDAKAVLDDIADLGFEAAMVSSRAGNRSDYLRRPDLGRQLDQASMQRLADFIAAGGCEVVVVIGDGLSPTAVHAHAAALLRHLVPKLAAARIKIGHVVVANGARVALGDEIGARLGARMVLVLLGERPGLSAPDSLGAYLTFAPRPGLTDADRNCVSNIRRQGLSHDEAAVKIAWLMREGLTRKVTGVALKDQSGDGTPHLIAKDAKKDSKPV